MSNALLNVLRLRNHYSALEFGADPTGATDSATAIQAAVTAVIQTGGVLFFPPGTYDIGAGISTSTIGPSGQPFTIQGAGVGATIFNRLSGCGNVFNFRNAPDGTTLRDFTLNVNGDTAPTSAAHGIVVGEASYVLVDNVVVNAPRDSGVMILSGVVAPEVTAPDIQACLVNNVRVFGGTPDATYLGIDVGILIAGTNVSNSGVTNCYVKDGGKDVSLSPGHGIELKYTGPNCYIDNCYVENCITGFGFVDDGAGNNVDTARISNIHAKNCTNALTADLDNSVVSNVIIDMGGDATALNPVYVRGSQSTYYNVQLLNLGNAAKYHLRFYAPASNNVFYVSDVYNTNSAKAIASFESGCTNNVVIVDNVTLPSITDVTTSGVFLDSNTAKSNSWSIRDLTKKEGLTIAANAITLHKSTEYVKLETEGAAATDDLDNINGGTEGQVITLATTANARDVVVKHNTGNLTLVGAADHTLSSASCSIVLRYSAALSKWIEVSRSTI